MTDLSKLAAGDEHYKAFVGPPLKYDLLGALQFTLLSAAGLRSHHKVCDVGCGSLRVGKLLIPYLDKDNYHGLEPNQWLIDEAIEQEIGQDLVNLKAPRFDNDADFQLSRFGEKFDFVIAQSIFSHSSATQIKACFKEVRQCLQAQGLFLATFIWGKQDYEGEEWVYPGCVSYRPQTIKDWAWKEYGLKMALTDWPHPNGQNWALFYLPENELKAEKLARFNLEHFTADVEAIPEQSQAGLISKFKSKVKRLIK
jgi:hypothetical protein